MISCQNHENNRHGFVDQVLELSINTSDKDYAPGEHVQFTQLYDSLAHALLEDKDEKIILVERLKKKGFEVSSHGRGNFPTLGARIILVELTRGDCICEVSKIYYATSSEDAWQMAEGITCKRKRQAHLFR